jgi:hypothetical protein
LRRAISAKSKHRQLVREDEDYSKMLRGDSHMKGKYTKDYELLLALYQTTLLSLVQVGELVEPVFLEGPTLSASVQHRSEVQQTARDLMIREFEFFVFGISLDFMADEKFPSLTTCEPGSLYYKTRPSLYVFGILSHHLPFAHAESRHLYWYLATVAGFKNSNHVLSIVFNQFMVLHMPAWLRPYLRHFAIHMDGAPSTNRNQTHVKALYYKLAATPSMLSITEIISIAGHSKQEVDNMFAILSKAWHRQDILTFQDVRKAFDQNFRGQHHQLITSDFYDYRGALRESFGASISGSTNHRLFRAIRQGGSLHVQRKKRQGDDEPWECIQIPDISEAAMHDLDVPCYAGHPVAGRKGRFENYPVALPPLTAKHTREIFTQFIPQSLRSEDPWPFLLESSSVPSSDAGESADVSSMVSSFSIDDVGYFLCQMQLSSLVSIFENNKISGSSLAGLNVAKLQQIGVGQEYHAVLLQHISMLYNAGEDRTQRPVLVARRPRRPVDLMHGFLAVKGKRKRKQSLLEGV